MGFVRRRDFVQAQPGVRGGGVLQVAGGCFCVRLLALPRLVVFGRFWLCLVVGCAGARVGSEGMA